ncbi:MAG: hypothetical protein M3Z20_15330, partial [Chloroflexota bacterium]|nr:hypothetical protein [Chloroflexota bacterium]
MASLQYAGFLVKNVAEIVSSQAKLTSLVLHSWDGRRDLSTSLETTHVLRGARHLFTGDGNTRRAGWQGPGGVTTPRQPGWVAGSRAASG